MIQISKRIVALLAFVILSGFLALNLGGCSAGGGQTTLLSITPEQYLASAKEQLETIEERDYEVRDLEEIIRVLENAEKDAKKTETIDRSRMYLVLANSLLARKKYKDLTVKGDYVSNNPEPFYVVNTKDVKETLRTANKWLRMCNSQFKTASLAADMNYVRGIYYMQKMLTVHNRERKEYLNEAVSAFRKCLGQAPDYKSEFRIFTKVQTNREVRLKLAEALAFGGQQADAYGIISEFTFKPIIPFAGATDSSDYAWHHTKGFVLATMGMYKEAAETLERFKIVSPTDYMQVDEALYYLQGVYERLAEVTKDKKYELEAGLVASMLEKLEGPFSSESYVTSAHLFPRPMFGDVKFFEGVIKFYNKNFEEARKIFESLSKRGAMSRANRSAALLFEAECLFYTNAALTDDMIENLINLAGKNDLTSMQLERLASLLAGYVMNKDLEENKSLVRHESQQFIRNIFSAPTALSVRLKKGELKRVSKELKDRKKPDDGVAEDAEREISSLIVEAYVNKPDDWITSTSAYIVELPEMAHLGKGRIVGREESGEWEFKDERINSFRRNNQYLIIIEYDNSDSEKSIQGILFKST